ncbi:MAG: flagellar motor protein MotB [Chloroflexota bacterium]
MSAHGGGGERWLVSYADFITVLLALFIVLFSMGNIDVAKYKALAESLKAALGSGGGPVSVVSPGIDKGGGLSPSNKQGLPAPISIPGLPIKPMTSADVSNQLSDQMQRSNLSGAITIQNNIEGALLDLGEQITFEAGTAILTPAAYTGLDRTIAMIKKMENKIRVIGHTDDSPPADPLYKDNWQLSLGRAMAVIDYMQKAGIPGYRLIATGRGQYEPLFPNDTLQHKALNSRVEIIIIYEAESDILKLPGNP